MIQVEIFRAYSLFGSWWFPRHLVWHVSFRVLCRPCYYLELCFPPFWPSLVFPLKPKRLWSIQSLVSHSSSCQLGCSHIKCILNVNSINKLQSKCIILLNIFVLSQICKHVSIKSKHISRKELHRVGIAKVIYADLKNTELDAIRKYKAQDSNRPLKNTFPCREVGGNLDSKTLKFITTGEYKQSDLTTK